MYGLVMVVMMTVTAATTADQQKQDRCFDDCLRSERSCWARNSKNGQCDDACRCRCEGEECGCRAACGVPCVSYMWCK